MTPYEDLDAKESTKVALENRMDALLVKIIAELDPSKVTELSEEFTKMQLEHAGLQQQIIDSQRSILADARAGNLNTPPYVQGYKEMRATLEEWSNTGMDAQAIARNARLDLLEGGANQPSLTGDNNRDRIITDEFDRGQSNAILDWSSEQQQISPQGYSLESVVVNVLGERYASVKNEMAEVAANTPAEAVAATNYFHGRVDELNQIRAAVVGQDQSLGAKIPSMTTDEIKIGYEEEESTGHEMGMSV